MNNLQQVSDSLQQIQRSRAFMERSLLLSKKWFTERNKVDLIELMVIATRVEYYSKYFPNQLLLDEDCQTVAAQWDKVASKLDREESLISISDHLFNSISRLSDLYQKNSPFSMDCEEDHDLEKLSDLTWGYLSLYKISPHSHPTSLESLGRALDTMSGYFWNASVDIKGQWVPLELPNEPAQMWWCHYSRLDFSKHCPSFISLPTEPAPPTSENMKLVGCYKD